MILVFERDVSSQSLEPSFLHFEAIGGYRYTLFQWNRDLDDWTDFRVRYNQSSARQCAVLSSSIDRPLTLTTPDVGKWPPDSLPGSYQNTEFSGLHQ